MVEVKGVRGGRTRFMSSRQWRAMWDDEGKGPRAESSDSISNFIGPNHDTKFKRRRMGHPPANEAEWAWLATFPLPNYDLPNSTSLLSRPPWMGMASNNDGMEERMGSNSNSMQSIAAIDDYYSYTPSIPNASDPFSFPNYTPPTPSPSTPPPNSPFYMPATPLLSPHYIDYYSYTPSTPNASDPFFFLDYTPSTPPPSPPPPNSPFYMPATPLFPIFHTLSPFQLLGSH